MTRPDGLTRRQFFGSLGAVALGALLSGRVGTAQGAPVRIGFAISETGPYAIGANITQLPNYLLWRDQVNTRGGLVVKGEGRRRVEFVQFDDRSDIETAIRLYERLISVERVDLLLPPWGTAMHFAVAPVFNRAGYPLLGPTVGSLRLRDMRLPYFYAMLAQPDAQMTALVGLLKEMRRRHGFNRVAVIYVNDLFGIEHYQYLRPLLRQERFEVVEERAYPLGVTDLSDVLRSLQGKRPDAFVGLTYPADTNLVVSQAAGIGFNPPLFYTAVGTAFPAFRDRFGGNAEGVMGIGVWNPKVPYRGAREYFQAHVEKFRREPDRWASAFTYAALQILERAVAEVGLDRARIKEYLDANTFETVVGPVRFVNGINRATPGMVGQWQRGEFEVVWPRERATAEPVVPKPSWR
ncbi:MAG: amino acid ABC transporter substrate-binding protein [Armatimonadota bacterium]|nr:amino acid ABC transporter substrate-binding protein [Armatimonadota bacterium]